MPQNYKTITVSNFSGGMNNSDSELNVQPHQHTFVKNMLVDSSELKPLWGHETVGEIEGYTIDAVYDWYTRFNDQDRVCRIVVARRNNVAAKLLFIEEQEIQGGNYYGTGTYRCMYRQNNNPSSGDNGDKWEGQFAEYGGYLYITGFGNAVESGDDKDGTPICFNGFAPTCWASSADGFTGTVADGTRTKITLSDTPSGDPENYNGYMVTISHLGTIETRMIVKSPAAGLDYYVDYAFTQAFPAGSKVVVAGLSPMGIEAPCVVDGASDPFSIGVGGGGEVLAKGVYKYKFAYKCSERGIVSNASKVYIVTIGAEGSDGPPMNPFGGCDALGVHTGEPVDSNDSKWGLAHVDQIQIWRTKKDGSTYYLVKTVDRDTELGDSNYTFGTQTDTVTDADIEAHPETYPAWTEYGNELHDPPTAFTNLTVWNDHLVASEVFDAGAWQMSNIAGPEYWPAVDISSYDPEELPRWAGTRLSVGSNGNPITAIIADAGAYAETGTAGSTSLIFTKSFAKRVSGNDLTDIRLSDAFQHGCIATHTAKRCGSFVVWQSRQGTMCVQAGGSNPFLLSAPIRDSLVSYNHSEGEARWQTARAVFWNNYYIMQAPAINVHSGELEESTFLCYMGRDGTGGQQFAWTQAYDTMEGNWFHVSNYNLGSYSSLYGGQGDLLQLSRIDTSIIRRAAPWKVTQDSSSVEIAWRKHFGFLTEQDVMGLYVLRRVLVTVTSAATTALDLTLKVWEFGENSSDNPSADPAESRSTYTKTLSYASGKWSNTMRRVVFEVENPCRWPMIELSASIAKDFRIKAVKLEFSYHGDVATE